MEEDKYDFKMLYYDLLDRALHLSRHYGILPYLTWLDYNSLISPNIIIVLCVVHLQ